jgi:hypothetical protein
MSKITIGEMMVSDWEQTDAPCRRCVFQVVRLPKMSEYLGGIWIEQVQKDIWEVDFTMELRGGVLNQNWTPTSFGSIEKAKKAVDEYLRKMAELISFA